MFALIDGLKFVQTQIAPFLLGAMHSFPQGETQNTIKIEYGISL